MTSLNQGLDVNPLAALVLFPAMLLLVWLTSFGIEARRKAPRAPEVMPWDPGIRPFYVTVDGVRLRVVKVGRGPALLLLHTLRTQLDLFHKVIRELAESFTVYALDYPGHGYSDIPNGSYDADFFVRYVDGFLEELDLTEVTVCGVSIGASISLILAARSNPRVERIIPINPYDYDRGRGIARASFLARIVVTLADIPIVGETVMRLRNRVVIYSVLKGGVSDPSSISPTLLEEMYEVGNRPGHYRGFVNLLRNASSWERARTEYRSIRVPTHMIWGADDWTNSGERRVDEALIPGIQSVTVESGGHFLPLDAPEEVMRHIRAAVDAPWGGDEPDR